MLLSDVTDIEELTDYGLKAIKFFAELLKNNLFDMESEDYLSMVGDEHSTSLLLITEIISKTIEMEKNIDRICAKPRE